MSSKLGSFFLFNILWLLTLPAHGQTQKPQIIAGVPTEYMFKLSAQADSGSCNVQVSIDGVEISQQEANAPDYEVKVLLMAPKEGPINIRWEGKTKFRGLKTVSACSGSGVIREIVAASPEQIRSKWAQLFTKLNMEQAECVKLGIGTLRLQIESTNPGAQLVGPEAPEVKVVYEKCDQFIAKRLKTSFDCVVGNVPTKCSEQYYDEVAGKRSLLTRQEALIAHFEGRVLKTVSIEVDSIRQARLKQEEARREKEAAALAAKKEQEVAERAALLAAKQAEEERERALQREKEAAEQAVKQAKEEHDQRLKSDPKYRREFEEAEKKRIAEQRALEAKAEREKQAAAKLERDAAAKIEREKLEAGKREAELEKQKAVLSDVDGLDKKHGTAAVLQCGNGVDDYLRKIAKYDFAWDEDTKGFFWREISCHSQGGRLSWSTCIRF